MKHIFTNQSAKEYIKNFISENNIKSGDNIVVRITPANLMGHHFLYLFDSEFIQNSNNNRNIHRPNIVEVATDIYHGLKRIERYEGCNRDLVVQRALKIETENREYGWTRYNCEDFVQEAWTGVPRSKKVENFTFLLFGAATLSALYGFKKKKDSGFALALIFLIIAIGINADRQIHQNKLSRLSY
jgi:hypothetical protein